MGSSGDFAQANTPSDSPLSVAAVLFARILTRVDSSSETRHLVAVCVTTPGFQACSEFPDCPEFQVQSPDPLKVAEAEIGQLLAAFVRHVVIESIGVAPETAEDFPGESGAALLTLRRQAVASTAVN